jgi:glutamate dehydrogenase
LMSQGGMIISRQEKSVTLTKEVAQLLNIDAKNASPHQILTAILKAEVDLLWFGGIGTYIRDKSESDADVGDRANDPIRVTATQVGAKVIGEGANLGITQSARISYAQNGGRCNSDAIDNSAGVNSSDVEVNIKIALANAIREDRLDLPRRNRLLSSMTNDVSKLVLRNNYLQTLAISLVQQQGVTAGGELARLMTILENNGQLNRQVETLPDDVTLQERLAGGNSLTRPEIGVLLSYAKIVLFDDVIDSNLPDEDYFKDTLVSYFPGKMLKANEQDIMSHRLRREIISTLIVNDAINRGGPATIVQMQDKTGASADDIVKAYILSRDGLFFDSIFSAIDNLDNKIDGALQNKLYAKTCDALIKTTGWALKTNAIHSDLSSSVPRLQSACEELGPKLGQYLPQFMQNHIDQVQERLITQSVPKKLAKELAELNIRTLIPEINQISALTQTSLDEASSAFFRVTEALIIGRLLNAADQVVVSDFYDKLALSRSLDEISQARRVLSTSALVKFRDSEAPVDAWEAENSLRIAQVQGQVNDLISSSDASVAKLTIAAGLITDLSRG